MPPVIQNPKGTRDFYPDDMAFQQHLFDSWHKSCRLYGFEQYEGPMFEHLELYTQKSGDEIEKQLYTFEDKGGRNIALRPELTPTLARMVAAQGTNLKRPMRWYSISRLFRYERMQKGRLREFIQINMDILGIEDVTADAELIAAAIGMMKSLGFDEFDFKARVSSRTLLEELFLGCGVNADKLKTLYALLDKKNKISPDVFSEELQAVVNDKDICRKIDEFFKCESIDDVEKFVETIGLTATPESTGGLKSLNQLKRLFALIDSYGLSDYLAFDIGIVRGLAYYTGIVFELIDIQGAMRAIAGGGRYDNLVGLYGGPPTPAVGFAAGDVVLGELIKAKSIAPPPPSRSDVFIISLDNSENAHKELIKAACKLRARGVSCEFSLKENQNIGKQLKSANNARARYVLFVGGDEGKAGQMKLKNLADGTEELISADGFEEKIAGAVA
ncbi:MAG: histidine--tRNA ligase [Chitinispirillales bacterium]|nr:histidine--tRNA ligase [Chitinispirillales bacterium]